MKLAWPWRQPAPAAEAAGAGDLCRRVEQAAQSLFDSLLCAPAVLVSLNRILGGGAEEKTLRRLAAALPEGLGGAGCLCGALGGAQLGLGLFLGDGLRPWNRLSPLSRSLHDQFRREHGSTCCRVLTKKVRHRPRAHLRQCAHLTGRAAALAAAIILEQRPRLLAPDPKHRGHK